MNRKQTMYRFPKREACLMALHLGRAEGGISRLNFQPRVFVGKNGLLIANAANAANLLTKTDSLAGLAARHDAPATPEPDTWP